jgi:rhodanese-related sulfurtransferase
VLTAAVADGAQLLDVRNEAERSEGTVPGSIESYVPDLAEATPEGLIAGREVWVACESGYRASLAASLLEARGFVPVVLNDAGIADVLAVGD